LIRYISILTEDSQLISASEQTWRVGSAGIEGAWRRVGEELENIFGSI
jgi:hypothetical protein